MSREQGRPGDDRRQLISRLRELVEALDARVPQFEREGEVQIATDAAALRSKAIARIARLELAWDAESPRWVTTSSD
jgi:hypothetical protein